MRPPKVAFVFPREESRTRNDAVSRVSGSLVTRLTSRGAMKATEEQTSACLLCASVSLWFNALSEASSKRVYHSDTEAQRRRTERRRESEDGHHGQSPHRSSHMSVHNGNGTTTFGGHVNEHHPAYSGREPLDLRQADPAQHAARWVARKRNGPRARNRRSFDSVAG